MTTTPDPIVVKVHCEHCDEDTTVLSNQMWIADFGRRQGGHHVAEALFVCPLCGDPNVALVGTYLQLESLAAFGADVITSTIRTEHPSGGAL